MKRILYLATRPRRNTRAFLVAVGLVFALVFGGCRTGKPDERHNAQIEAAPVSRITNSHDSLPSSIDLRPGPLSGIGRLFSTPEGVARRQAVRLAKASAPKIGKKAQGAIITGNGNNDVKQAQSTKEAGPATNAGAGAVVSNTDINKNKGAAATAPHATATDNDVKPGFPWWKVGAGVGSVLLLVLLFGTPAGPWLLALFKRRKQTDNLA